MTDRAALLNQLTIERDAPAASPRTRRTALVAGALRLVSIVVESLAARLPLATALRAIRRLAMLSPD